jgi:hypothetical protein
MTEPVEKPALTLEILFNGEPKTLRMVYGIEMDIRRLLPDPATAMQLMLMDQFTQDYVVRRLLTDTKKMVTKVEELIPAEEVDVSTEDVENILNWVLEHLLYFFAKRTTVMSGLGVRFNQQVPLTLFKNGSQDSTSPTPSVGPSESSKDS